MENQADAILEVGLVGDGWQNSLHDAPPQLGKESRVWQNAAIGEETRLAPTGEQGDQSRTKRYSPGVVGFDGLAQLGEAGVGERVVPGVPGSKCIDQGDELLHWIGIGVHHVVQGTGKFGAGSGSAGFGHMNRME